MISCQRGGEPGVAKVVDFGLAKQLDSGGDSVASTVTSIIGTPLYLSPESIGRPGELDARSDLYALGALGYFLLTGTPVFSGGTVVEICGHHLHTTPEPPSKRLGRPLPTELEGLVLRLLAKQPAERPESAAEVALRLASLPGRASWTRSQTTACWARALEQRARPRAPSARATTPGTSQTLAVDFRNRQGRTPGARLDSSVAGGQLRARGRMRIMASIYDRDLDKNPANYASLSPLSFLAWAADVYPEQPAVVHGERRYSWSETYARCRALASALQRRGIGRGDTVSVMCLNTPEMYEAHFGIPMTGAVLNALNTRLDADAIAFMLEHAETRAVIVDRELAPVMSAALEKLSKKPPLVIDVNDSEYTGPGERIGSIDYESFLATGDRAFAWQLPRDEWDAISLNYTSGTTGNPKGVVYHHRGAYLNALSNVLHGNMPRHSVYLWTLPMFHCNGWCYPWAIAANAGLNVCLRKVEAAPVFEQIRKHKVTHYCGAPIVHNLLIHAPESLRSGIAHRVTAFVGGAAPPAAMIEGMAKLGFDLTHVYGLTEVYGPAALCAKHDDWAALPVGEQAAKNGRQGVRAISEEGMTVLDPKTMEPVPADGETIGEIMFRGNVTMKGYLKNPAATQDAFAGGWFHSGDLAVLHPDGYAKIKDRAKDVIISGGENISSLEVEDALYRHPAVLAAAVVAQPDPKWGETPCAFVELKPDATATEAEIIAHCRNLIARFKAPSRVVFGVLPKTSTGKIQKFVLREQAKSASAIE